MCLKLRSSIFHKCNFRLLGVCVIFPTPIVGLLIIVCATFKTTKIFLLLKKKTTVYAKTLKRLENKTKIFCVHC